MLLTARNQRNAHGTHGKSGIVNTFLPSCDMLGKYICCRTTTHHVIDVVRLLSVDRWGNIPLLAPTMPVAITLE